MFDSLSKRLTSSFDALRRRGTLSQADVDTALRDIRMALLEADVALPVAKEFITSLKEKIIGEKIIASVSPAQMVVKLVHDALVELLGGATAEHGEGIKNAAYTSSLRGSASGLRTPDFANHELNLNIPPPAVILMCGLQGSGKTTSTAKLAKRLKEKQRKKVLVASLDIYRPAAQEQLATVAKAADVTSLSIVAGEKPEAISKRALHMARTESYDVLLLDTAGRLHIDESLMDELKAVRDLAQPIETLLVADSLTGQDAVNIAKSFHEMIGITGIILTRLDGDGRGGAALSMKHVTGQPIKFAGMGEKIDEFEVFHPERIASRILDMGDVVSFVEKAAENFSEQDAKIAMEKMQSGKFDMNDMLQQMKQIQKMGGMGTMLSMMPGAGKIQEALKGKSIDEKRIVHQEAMILSMTKAERANPNLLNASRRRRIAIGAGRTVQELNQLIKQYQQMETMMKQMKKIGMKGMMNPANLKRLLGG